MIMKARSKCCIQCNGSIFILRNECFQTILAPAVATTTVTTTTVAPIAVPADTIKV